MKENKNKYFILVIIILILVLILLNLLNNNKNPNKENKTDNTTTINLENDMSDEELYKKLNTLMRKKKYNEYAIKVINTFIPDYKKLFENKEIYNLFKNINSITLNPYNPEEPNLSHTDRAYNADGNIIVNCFEGELENDNNLDGLRWLLTHEIMHSLGSFPETNTKDSFDISIMTRNSFLEEGLADSIAHFVKGTEHDTKFGLKIEEKFIMYEVTDTFEVNEERDVSYSYGIGGNVINLFKYIGCYDEIIESNINSSFKSLKQCTIQNVIDGEKYYNELFKILNKIYLYFDYPNTFLTQEQALEKYKDYEYELLDILIKNNSLNELVIEYAKISTNIINNKKDETYSICDFYNSNAILYKENNSEKYINEINCS